jgi:hypothetical protein
MSTSAPAALPIYSAIADAPIHFFDPGQHKLVTVSLSAITFVGGQLQIDTKQSWAAWVTYLVKHGVIKPGPKLPPVAAKPPTPPAPPAPPTPKS